MADPDIAGYHPARVPDVEGLKAHYDSPYQLMSYLGKNVNLHLSTGLLLVVGVLVGIVVRR